MLQQIIALLVILFFLSRLFWQKKKGIINGSEFLFWFFFWLVSAFAVIFLKQIDKLVGNLGFSGSGIDILIYIAVVTLFYLVFKLRIKIEKQERNMTKIVREIALKRNS